MRGGVWAISLPLRRIISGTVSLLSLAGVCPSCPESPVTRTHLHTHFANSRFMLFLGNKCFLSLRLRSAFNLQSAAL